MESVALDLLRSARLLRFAFRCMVELVPGTRSETGRLLAYRRLRDAIEREGVTYVKIGQFLAMRFDLLPKPLCDELSRLFDGVAPVPFEQVHAVLKSEFDREPAEVFAHIERRPVAAASIAQVHEARTHDGRRVAVKILRPGINRTFAADMRIFRRIAWLADALHLTGSISLKMLVAEFAKWTLRELDFPLEARMADALGQVTGPGVQVPKIDWSRTGSKVLTMEFIEGVTLARVADLRRTGGDEAVRARIPGFDAKAALHHLASSMLHSVFDQGVFHGDLHPGNILVRADSIGLVDFGIVGTLAGHRRELLASYYERLLRGDIDGSFRLLAQMWTPTEAADTAGFEREVKAAISVWHRAIVDPDAPLAATHWGKSSDEIFHAARRAHYMMHLDMLLFFRTMGQLHASFLMLGVDFIPELRAFLVGRARRQVMRQFEPEAALERIAVAAGVRASLPPEICTFLRQAASARWQQRIQRLAQPPSRVASTRALALALISVAVAASASALHLEQHILVAGAGALTLAVLSLHFVWTLRSRAA
jgi:ubiquinone biosynthesis protein